MQLHIKAFFGNILFKLSNELLLSHNFRNCAISYFQKNKPYQDFLDFFINHLYFYIMFSSRKNNKFLLILQFLIFFMGISTAAYLYLAFGHLEWKHIPFHSTIEAVGGMVAILIACVLYQKELQEINSFFFTATGFACMGVLDLFHAASLPGEVFVFLHSTASLCGGFFFALIWLPDKLIKRYAKEQRWIAGLSILLAVSIGLRAMFYPHNLPDILRVYKGEFTNVAIAINITASLLFLASIPKFHEKYRKTQQSPYLLFMGMALLFGTAELLFQFSNKWNGIWWTWHCLRITAYFMTLVFIADRYIYLLQRYRLDNGDAIK